MSDAKPTVFVVDEDASVRASLKLLLESAGWEAETFASGLEFLSGPHVLTKAA
jgi:FixJ family two-component response regulator